MPRKEQTFSKNTFKEEPLAEEPVSSPPKKAPVKKEKSKKVTKEKNNFQGAVGLIETVKSEKFQKVTGLFLLLFAIFLLIAFVSYLFTWKTDDNIFANSIWKVLSDNSLQSENWMGKIGAVFSFLFIKNWFGIGSVLFVFWLIVLGSKMLFNLQIFPLAKSTLYTLFGLFWISVSFAFVLPNEKHLILSGAFGYQINVWLNSVIGKIGTGILLFFLMVSFLIIEYNLHKLFRKKTQRRNRRKY